MRGSVIGYVVENETANDWICATKKMRLVKPRLACQKLGGFLPALLVNTAELVT